MGGLETTLLKLYGDLQRPTAVLVAALAPRGERCATTTEPEAVRAIGQCLEALGSAAAASGGRVVKRRGNEVIALFPSANAAATAAARMQLAAQRILGSRELGVRAAFHTGPVAQRGHDVVGDTVNIACELASEARPGQVLTSQESASTLGPQLRTAVHSLRKARSAALPVGELAWQDFAHAAAAAALCEPRPRAPAVHLVYRYNALMRRREGDMVTIGRDPDCDVCVDVRLASRRHCTVERNAERVLLRDHSTNGTFVTVEGEREIRIRAEELALHGRGWLSFGASRLLADELVQFRCE